LGWLACLGDRDRAVNPLNNFLGDELLFTPPLLLFLLLIKYVINNKNPQRMFHSRANVTE